MNNAERRTERRTERIAHFRTDYSRMSTEPRARLEQDLIQHYFAPRYQCSPFDPTALVALAKQQHPGRPEFAEALARCTQQWRKNEMYAYFADPQAKDRSRYHKGFVLDCPRQGALVVDVAVNGAIFGIEYIDAVKHHRGDADQTSLVAQGPPVLRIVHWK